MALYPCDQGNHRYPGRQQTAYPALLVAGQSERGKLRLCPKHFAEYVHQFDHTMYDAARDDAPMQCMVCANDQVGAAVFVTYYEAGQERSDLWGSACEAHLPQVREALKLNR